MSMEPLEKETHSEHALPGQLEAEGFRLHVSDHPDGTSIATVHRHGQVVTRLELGPQGIREEAFQEPRAGVRQAVAIALATHRSGQEVKDRMGRGRLRCAAGQVGGFRQG